MPIIYTHQSPDMDALVATWLLWTFHKWETSPVEIRFVPASSPASSMDGADAIVDCGREFDSAKLRFDHHQFPGKMASETCAAKMVWEYLLNQSGDENKSKIFSLQPLIDLVLDGDRGLAKESRKVGIHALWVSHKLKNKDRNDFYLTTTFFETIKDIADNLYRNRLAEKEMQDKLCYVSSDRKVVCIREGKASHTQQAFEDGAEVVVFYDTSMPDTKAVGVIRAPESNLDVCDIVRLVRADAEMRGSFYAFNDENRGKKIVEEIDRWFFHNAGFFAGRGTVKSKCNVEFPGWLPHEVARIFDKVWVR